eukprot:7476936-Pyramimonas_sp.AAC.1
MAYQGLNIRVGPYIRRTPKSSSATSTPNWPRRAGVSRTTNHTKASDGRRRSSVHDSRMSAIGG